MTRALIFSLACAIGCGGSDEEQTAADVVDASGETAVLDGGDDVSDTAGDTSADAVAETDSATSSRCTITETTVACTHTVTPLKASPAITRDVYWQTPLTARPAKGYPAVIVYQGSFAGPALTWATLSKSTPFGGFYQGVLHARLLDNGFTVIAPTAAAGVAWQTNNGAPWESTSDHTFINQLLVEIEKGTYGPVDLTRLYATGISSGGYMTSRMAVSYAGRFRALAVNAGSYATCAGSICNIPDKLPADHPPTLFLHGEKDATVPIATMRPYPEKLTAQGVAAASVIDPSAGHEWLSVSPERITDWFLKH